MRKDGWMPSKLNKRWLQQDAEVPSTRTNTHVTNMSPKKEEMALRLQATQGEQP
jgi:hypothetical protein